MIAAGRSLAGPLEPLGLLGPTPGMPTVSRLTPADLLAKVVEEGWVVRRVEGGPHHHRARHLSRGGSFLGSRPGQALQTREVDRKEWGRQISCPLKSQVGLDTNAALRAQSFSGDTGR